MDIWQRWRNKITGVSMPEQFLTSNDRTLIDHKIEGIDNMLNIIVKDEPGQGGACHEYIVTFQTPPDENELVTGGQLASINFQNGPVKEFGVNGITQECLIAICMDRLRGFQSGPFASRDNALALDHLEQALIALQARTRDRLERGVEGTNVV
jgi:hypothetical protein